MQFQQFQNKHKGQRCFILGCAPSLKKEKRPRGLESDIEKGDWAASRVSTGDDWNIDEGKQDNDNDIENAKTIVSLSSKFSDLDNHKDIIKKVQKMKEKKSVVDVFYTILNGVAQENSPKYNTNNLMSFIISLENLVRRSAKETPKKKDDKTESTVPPKKVSEQTKSNVTNYMNNLFSNIK